MSIQNALELKKWAVVGATDNPEKYGYKIFRRLKQMGYEVFPVNPNYETLMGEKCYPNLSSLPEVPEVINMVVSPRHGYKVVEEAATLGIKHIWLQPGTVDSEILRLIQDNNMEAIEACVLVEGR